MGKETLHFKIGLSSTLLEKKPQFAIFINDTKFIDNCLTVGGNQIEYFEFDAEINEGHCDLIIEFKNKTTADTIIKDGIIVEDLLLNIESIEIDEINLGFLLWTASNYHPIYPDSYKNNMLAEGKSLQESVQNCVNLGWNGRWILPFNSPFYMWLLENI